MRVVRKVCWHMLGKKTAGSCIITKTYLMAFLPIIFKEQYFKNYREEAGDCTAMPVSKYSYWGIEK